MRFALFCSLGLLAIPLLVSGCDSASSPTADQSGTLAPPSSTDTACGSGPVKEAINSDGGCTPAEFAGSAGTLKAGLKTFCLGNRQYTLQLNQWNSTEPQALRYGGGDYYFRMTEQQASVATNGGPTGYPSMFIGENGGRRTRGSGMPKRVSEIESAPTTWKWKDNGATDSATNIYNSAYDVWFSVSAEGDPDSYHPTGGFLMVWLHKPSKAQPIGSVKASDVTISGVSGTWDVWIGRNEAVPCISYVRTDKDPVYSMSFDLNLFIRDSVEKRSGTITDDMYLTNIFTGFEIWSGGVGVETTSFCAAVL
jgi:hypothetical protein